MKNDFNKVAGFYDLIQQIAFGNTLVKAAAYFLNKLEKNSRVLILGGGTGKILNYVGEDIEVDYLDLSKRMISQASAYRSEKIVFIRGDFLEMQLSGPYDTVICPFFLDVFCQDNLETVLSKILMLLRPNGRLVVSDFRHTGKKRDRILIFLMYLFFRVFSHLESRNLPSIHSTILKNGFRLEDRRFFRKGLIFSHIYRN